MPSLINNQPSIINNRCQLFIEAHTVIATALFPLWQIFQSEKKTSILVYKQQEPTVFCHIPFHYPSVYQLIS